MHFYMKYITEKFKFTKQTLSEMKKNSKNFYKKMNERRSIRFFNEEKFDINIIKNAILAADNQSTYMEILVHSNEFENI